MNRLLKTITSLIILTNWLPLLFSQEIATKEFIRSVQDADIVYLYDKDYEKAAGMYESLLKVYPGNANIEAKLGFCYLNIEEKKQDALRLLKHASTNIASDQEYSFYGDKAPRETYLNLALAYHMNDSLEKAISMYTETRKTLGKFDAPQAEYIDIQINACRSALEARKKPLTILSELFAPWLKDYPGACNPVISKNDSVFVFTQRTAGITQILCSYKTAGKWGLPHNITGQLGGYNRFYTNSITGNGRLLVLFMDDGADGNLYFSQRNDTTWSRIRGPGKPVNTIYWESHGFITPDGNTIFLASNRPGGSGELDIWASEKLQDGSWGNPVNCGDVINTLENEDTPFFDTSTSKLYFSSSGHPGLGGYDMFSSTRENNIWTSPVALPYSLNTTTDNKFLIRNNTAGFVAVRVDEKNHTRNIYSLQTINPADEITVIGGVLSLEDGTKVDPLKTSVRLTDISKKNAFTNIPVKKDGSFNFEIKPGNYMLFVSHQGYKTDTINLNLPLNFLSHHMVINPELAAEKTADTSFQTIKDILFEFDSYEVKDQAKPVLETLISIIRAHPDLKVEIAGYTDAIGSSDYNLRLADKRVQSTIDYLISSGIPASPFVRNSFGESYSAALNTNNDGSDNPEGRKYNRRVAFGVIEPQTGIVIRQDSRIPENLRPSIPEKFTIILKKSAAKLGPEYFDKLNIDGMTFIYASSSGSLFVYSIGFFYGRQEAEKYLSFARDKGFADAYIANSYEPAR